MMTTERTEILNDERLAPVLSLIDEAWADGELTDTEIAAVCMALIRRSPTEISCRETLRSWLDREQPPTAEELEELRARIGS